MSFLLHVSHMKIKSKNTLVISPFSPRHESPTSMSPGVVVGFCFIEPTFFAKRILFPQITLVGPFLILCVYPQETKPIDKTCQGPKPYYVTMGRFTWFSSCTFYTNKIKIKRMYKSFFNKQNEIITLDYGLQYMGFYQLLPYNNSQGLRKIGWYEYN